MDSVDNIRNGLIDKLLTIRNEDFLKALDKLVSSKTKSEEKIRLTPAQRKMLELSELGIANGRLISQEDLDKEDMEWLKEL